jgi:protease PrsW
VTGMLRRTSSRRALKVGLSGLVLWAATVVVTWTTQNPTLVPTVILLGSFLVPVVFVVWVVDSGTDVVSPRDVVMAFVVGGVLGILAASVLESRLLGGGPILTYLGVGLIEEFVKLAAVWWLARSLGRYTLRDGAVFGAAVGFGFAAFESAGYAFNSVLTLGGQLDLRALVETEILRGLLAPVGHGLWTAVLGAVLFAGGRRVTGRLVGWFLGISVLHAAWNLAGGVAAVLVWFFTAEGWQYALVEAGRLPLPTADQAHLYTVVSWGLLVVVGLVGVWALRRVMRSRS